jgi:hypothetical protein
MNYHHDVTGFIIVINDLLIVWSGFGLVVWPFWSGGLDI